MSVATPVDPADVTPPPSPSVKSLPSNGDGDTADKLKRQGSSQVKKKPSDFIFGKVIGEGSFSTVILAKEVTTDREFAIKVLEKRHIIKEKKTAYVHREKEVFSKLDHPFFVRLYFTFQDTDRLYFGLSYAPRGELLDYINKLGCFDENCTRFYAAEIVLALEHLAKLGIIHRDLKPENILLNELMHIQITDFGSAKILNKNDETSASSDGKNKQQRRNSFVGTAQYVSPEILTDRSAYFSSDLWALGCIIYQLLSGQLPFWGGHEYQIFQKITKLEYEFPEGFHSVGRDLVEKLLVIDPLKRLGCEGLGGFEALKAHKFLQGTHWEDLDKQEAPELLPYLPAKGAETENLWGQSEAGLNDEQLSKLIGIGISESPESPNDKQEPKKECTYINISEEERQRKLEVQRRENEFHRFVEGNLILKQGLVDKRKGLFARRRMLLLTEGPHLYYVDAQAMVLKGEIPWSKELRPEAKNFKIFFVHTPNRTYYLEQGQGFALEWVKKIEEVWQRYYGTRS